MYTGSMVGAGAMAFALMPYAIANARPDEGSTVDLNPTVLAAVFGESVDTVNAAIRYLCSPDPHSRSPDEEGRRLVQCGPGPYRYRVVNLHKYREDANNEHRRGYWAAYRKWERGGRKGKFVFTVNTVNKSELFNSVQRTDADADADAGTKVPTPTPSSKEGDLVKPLPDFPPSHQTDRFLAKWKDWMECRRARKKPRSWSKLFGEQIQWLSKFDEPTALEILSSSIRNGYQGLFEPKAPPPGAAGDRPHTNTPLDMKTIIQAKESLAAEVKTKHATEGPFGLSWNTPAARTEYSTLQREIRELKTKLSNMG